MESVSPFQFLPTHVVQIVIKHVVAPVHMLSDGTLFGYREYRELLRPLLQTCSNIRLVALPRYCYHFIMMLTTKVFRECVIQYSRTGCLNIGWNPHEYLGYPTHHLVKELDIDVAEKSFYSGTVMKMLSYMPYKYCEFPLVRKLTIFISSDELDSDRVVNESEIGANIGAFVQWVKRAMPRISELRLWPKSSDRPWEIDAHHFGDLGSRLIRLASRVRNDLHNKDGVPVRFQLDGIRDLVSIVCHNVEDSSQFIMLARQSAQTLQHLDSLFSQPANLVDLIQSADDSYVTYPRLSALTLYSPRNDNQPSRPVFYGAVPFPNLRLIVLRNIYPFGDDVLFRGNADTLEGLDLPYDHISATMLIKRKVFTPTSHPKLLYVKAWRTGSVVPDTFATFMEEVRFTLSIGPGAPIRTIERPKSVSEVVLAFTSMGHYACIQALILPGIFLGLLDIITLIKSLPLLSDLTVSPFIREPEIAGVIQSELPTYMISTYFPMGERFRCLGWNYITDGDDDNINILVEHVLLLALVCPNYTHTVQFHICQKDFQRGMDEAIAADRFKDHTSRLQRMRFSRW